MASAPAADEPDAPPPWLQKVERRKSGPNPLLAAVQRRQCKCGPLPLHMLFLLLFTSWLVNSRDSEQSYAFAQMVRERVMEQEFHVQDTQVATRMNDITSMSQVQHFLRGPLLHAMFGMQDSRVTGDFDLGYVMSQARLIGAARIRQIRVATNSCSVSQFRFLEPTCYPSLEDGTRRRAPIYGVNLGGGMRRVYRYTPALYTDLPHVALVNGYLPGGYIVDLPARRIHASAVLDMMERDKFMSIETRAIIIDFTLYNANINTFCIVRITFEVLETGGVLPYGDFRTARLLPYEGDTGETQYILDVLVITWVCIIITIEIVRLRIAYKTQEGFTFRRYFGKKWMVFEWVWITLFWVILSMKWYIPTAHTVPALTTACACTLLTAVHCVCCRYIRSSMQQLGAAAPFDPNTHYPLYATGAADIVKNNFLAIAALLSYLKLFKYIGHLPLVRRRWGLSIRPITPLRTRVPSMLHPLCSLLLACSPKR